MRIYKMKAKDEIYDRIDLCNEIISEIQDIDETHAYILYSGTGVGKSSVSKKIAKIIIEKDLDKDAIQIQSAQDKNTYEGFFLECIFKYIKKFYLIRNNKNKAERKKYKKSSFHYFIKHQKFSVIKKIIESSVVNVEDCKNAKTMLFQFLQILFHYISIKLNLEKDIEQNNVDSKTMISYIKYILKKGDVVLCIENTQNFDKTSLDTLTELLIETKTYRNYFIFEFTLTKNLENLRLLDRIKSELDYSEIDYKTSELKKLEFEYIFKLAKNFYQTINPTVIVELEKMYTGNIKKIENFLFNYSVQTVKDDDPTFVLLQGLSNSQKYILAIIILNNANIEEQLLKKVVNNSNNFYISNINEDIRYLINDVKLLEQRDKSICIKDTDTIDSWSKNTSNFKKYEALAYKNCEAILLRIFQNSIDTITQKKMIFLLWQLYNKFDNIKLNNLLEHIDAVIYEILSVEDLIIYLRNLIDTIYPRETSINLLYKIFDICERHQLIDLECLCIEKIRTILQGNLNEKFLFSYYTYLLQKEEYQFLLYQINEQEELHTSQSFKYYIQLFKIVAFVSLNQTVECRKLVNILEIDSFFSLTAQYGYYLRLAEAYDKRNVAIPKVEKSILIFEKNFMNIQAAKSRVSLCFLYSITGNLEKAQEVLDSAEKVLLKNIENKHVFNINKACLCLLKHNYGKDVWAILNESERYANTRFDKIAIIINKLILCIENHDFEKGKYYEKKGLELLELEYNHHLHAIFYYNCYVLYKTMGQAISATKYYNLALDCKEYCDTLKARLENKNEVEDQTTFLLQYPWHVCFVSYWYFDYLFENR